MVVNDACGGSARPGGRRRRTVSTASFLSLLVLLATTAGCGASSAREDLSQAIEDTGAAVRTVSLAVDLLGQGQTTAAAAEVTARDMSEQIGKAQQQLVKVPGPDADVRALRARTQLVITQAQVAVQDVEDVLSAGEDAAAVTPQLTRADQALNEAAAAVGER